MIRVYSNVDEVWASRDVILHEPAVDATRGNMDGLSAL